MNALIFHKSEIGFKQLLWMNFQQNWLKVLECVETLINYIFDYLFPTFLWNKMWHFWEKDQ